MFSLPCLSSGVCSEIKVGKKSGKKKRAKGQRRAVNFLLNRERCLTMAAFLSTEATEARNSGDTDYDDEHDEDSDHGGDHSGDSDVDVESSPTDYLYSRRKPTVGYVQIQ